MSEINIKADLSKLSKEKQEQFLALVKEANAEKWTGPSGNFMIFSGGDVGCRSSGDRLLEHFRKNGMVAKTQEQGKYKQKQLSLFMWMLDAWMEVVGDWRPDWRQSNGKIVVSYDFSENEAIYYDLKYLKPNTPFVFPNDAKAEQWFEMIGEERIKEFGT